MLGDELAQLVNEQEKAEPLVPMTVRNTCDNTPVFTELTAPKAEITCEKKSTSAVICKGDIRIEVYSPDDVSRVWLLKDGQYVKFTLIEKRFEGRSVQTVGEMKEMQKAILNEAAEDNRQARIDLSRHIHNVADHTAADQPDVKGIRNRRKAEIIKRHIEIGGEIK